MEFLIELEHGNIVGVTGFVEELPKNIVWLVLPWEENGNLRDFLASENWQIPERISLVRLNSSRYGPALTIIAPALRCD